jgi:hypothetical protein
MSRQEFLKQSWASVAHTYNPSYSGGTDQEDLGSMPAQASSSQNPVSKIPSILAFLKSQKISFCNFIFL